MSKGAGANSVAAYSSFGEYPLPPPIPRKGDYGVVVNPGFTGWMIRLFQRISLGRNPSPLKLRAARYSHAFVVVNDYGTVVEAKGRGACLRDIREYDGRPLLYSTTPLTEVERVRIAATAKMLIGTPYGFLDIVYIGLRILGVQWRWLLRRVLSEKHMICSQLVAYCGAAAGVTEWLCGQTDAQLVIPAMLAELASEPGEVREAA